MTDFWMEMARNGPASARIGGTEVARGSRVRLRPRAGGDAHDLFLAGRIAVVEAIDEDGDGALHLSVTLEDDPGRDLGENRFLGHRFFFSPAEVEPLGDASPAPPAILVAGIGNIFLGDDGFGVEVVRRLSGEALPAGVEVVDFGIRGMDLAYALQKPYAAVVMVDAAPRGGAPGTLYVIEPDAGGDGPVELATHAMDPVRVLRLARTLGVTPPRTLVVACEPQAIPDLERYDDVRVELSEPVRAAVDEAVRLVTSLVQELAADAAELPPSSQQVARCESIRTIPGHTKPCPAAAPAAATA